MQLPGRRVRVVLGVLVTLALAAALVLSAWRRHTAPRPTPGLLASARVATVVPGLRVERLTDGVVPDDGSAWNAPGSAILGSGATVRWDLGRVVHVRSAFLQGDDNDRYRLRGSLDGNQWSALWEAPVLHRGGLQRRWSDALDAELRYLELDSPEGDSSRSVSEVALWEDPPPPLASRTQRLPLPERRRGALLTFGVACLAAMMVVRRGDARRGPRSGDGGARWTWAVAGLLVVAGGGELVGTWATNLFGPGAVPIGAREVALVRGVAATLGLGAVLWQHLSPRAWPASPRATGATLVLAMVLGVAGFFNLFRPQFWDHERGRASAVHCHDLRVYYPAAKYFDELGFDGVYLASVAAFIEDVPGSSVESLRAVTLRDLRTHRVVKVGEVAPAIQEIHRRFAPERWRAFVQDMRYFRLRMGREGYLGSLNDHGGNATPVWLTLAHGLFARTTASDALFLGTALLDPLLLLVALVALGRAYGWRAAVTSALVFGASDFAMFGSNWAGATLRHDWMAYLGLGFAALRVERWAVGGAFLALAASIRAFPAVTLVVLGLPFLGAVVTARRAEGRWPGARWVWERQQPLLRAGLGAAAALAVVVALSAAVLGPSAWGAWLDKVRLLDGEPHTNHESLRALVAGSTGAQAELLAARWPVMLAGTLGVVGLLAAAAWRAPLDRAAVLGLGLVPVLFNPANYYLHVLFLLPLLGAPTAPRPQTRAGCPDQTSPHGGEPTTGREVWVSGTLLALTAAQYITTLERDEGLHFYQSTALLFAGLVVTLAAVARRGWDDLEERAGVATDAHAP